MPLIMIVDDNPDIIYSVKKGLEALNKGYVVLGANNGRDCLEMLHKNKPDLVLLDIMMPQIDGWDVVAQIKQTREIKDMPIIFLTAKNDLISKGMAKFSVDDYIVKPVDMKELDSRITKKLK